MVFEERSGRSGTTSPLPGCLLFLDAVQHVLAAEDRRGTQFFSLDAQELVVLGQALAAGGGPGLELAGVGGNGHVGKPCVLGLSGTVGKDRGEPCPARHLDGLDGLGQGAYLVHLDEDGVGSLLLDAPGKGSCSSRRGRRPRSDLATHALHELLPASQSSSARPSSMDTMGNLATRPS